MLVLPFTQEAKRKVPLLKQHVSAMETGAARGFNRLVAEAELDFAEADGYVSATACLCRADIWWSRCGRCSPHEVLLSSWMCR